MAALHCKLLRISFILLKVLITLVIIGVIWQFTEIQLRLTRNGKIAHHLVDALESRFPRSEFGGAASYESEIIYIHVRNHVTEAKRQDIEGWLREQKIEQRIAPRNCLRFLEDKEENDIMIK